MNGLTPDVFKSFFFYQINSDLDNHETRRSDNIVVDLRRGPRSSFSTKHLGPSVWNELPLGIRVAEDVPQFKKNLKVYFWGANSLNFIMASSWVGEEEELER